MRIWYEWRNSFWPIAVGVVLVVLCVHLRNLSLRSRDWPTVPGVITESSVSEYQSRGQPHKRWTITYRYGVAGRTYRGDVVSYARLFRSDEEAAAEVQRYPEGSAVAVHYDPKDPGMAALESGSGRSLGWIILAGLGLIAYGGWKGLR